MRPRRLHLEDSLFGKLRVLHRYGVTKFREVLWLCRCECTREIVVRAGSLRRGYTSHCKECQHGNFKHGERARRNNPMRKRTPTYITWNAMRDRCLRSSHNRYYNYGGRGIKICDRWGGENGFENFLEDMGERLQGTTLDRIDVNGNYEPSNCRWANSKQQSKNRRKFVAIQNHPTASLFLDLIRRCQGTVNA